MTQEVFNVNEDEVQKAINNVAKRAQLSKAVGFLLSEFAITSDEAIKILERIDRMNFNSRQYLSYEDIDLLILYLQTKLDTNKKEDTNK